MSCFRRMSCAVLLAFSAVASAQMPKPGSVSFRGKTYEPAAMPEEAGPAAKAAVHDWSTWAKTHGYRMDLDPSHRVLLVSTKVSVDAPMALVLKTIALFDSLFSTRTEPAAGDAGAAAKPAKPGTAAPEDGIPEDPETPPPGAPKTLPPDRGVLPELAKEAPLFQPDAQVAVMLVLKNSADYTSLLDHLVEMRAYLKDWTSTAAMQIGFTLEDPMCGAYNENSPGQEEWNPDNELIHRTMAMLVLRRFSDLPYWLHTGLCWYAELKIAKSIYCMPYRDGFVSVGEHDGWAANLNSLYAGRSKEPLHMTELALKRGKWDGKAAKTAWGMVDYLCKVNPRSLSSLMEDLRRSRYLEGRTTNPDGTWTKILDYELPGEEQRVLLEKYFGANVLRDAITYWTSGAVEPVK